LTLLLRLIALYARPLLEAGMVYAAIPPLFGVPMGKDKYKYFVDKKDYYQYIQKKFSTDNVLTDINGKAMSTKSIVDLLDRTDNYISVLESTATNYAIDPCLLESILINKDLTPKKFKSAIEKQYRFMNVRTENGITVLDGLAGNKAHLVFLTPRLLSACGMVMSYLNANEPYYRLNGEVVSLYGLRIAFGKYEPSHLQRFKGLGEMNAKMLGISTLRPDGDRLLVRYTFEDINREINEMRKLNDNKELLLKGIGKIPRQDILG
jgi:DNA gyrase/topoisomerase IV subunit B